MFIPPPFRRTGKAVASANYDGTIQIWEAPVLTGPSVWIAGEREYGKGAFNVAVSFSESVKGFEQSDIQVENGAIIRFSGSGDSYKATIQPSSLDTTRVMVAANAVDGRNAASNIFRFNPALKAALKEHAYSVSAVAYSPDGETLAIGDDQEIHLWNPAAREPLRTIQGAGWVNFLDYSPDGTKLVSGYGNSEIRIWSVETGKTLQTLKGHTGSVNSVSYSRDGSMLASASGDRTVRIWDADTGEHLQTLKGHKDDLASAAFSSDGSMLASGSYDNTIRIWSLATGETARMFQMQFGDYFTLAFSPVGSAFAVGGSDDVIRIWDAATGKPLHTLTGHTDWVYSLAFSPDGSMLASGSKDHTIRIWDIATGKQIRTLEGHTNEVYFVAFSQDGRSLASYGDDDAFCIWEFPAPAGAEKK